jgi:hypothetical protein
MLFSPHLIFQLWDSSTHRGHFSNQGNQKTKNNYGTKCSFIRDQYTPQPKTNCIRKLKKTGFLAYVYVSEFVFSVYKKIYQNIVQKMHFLMEDAAKQQPFVFYKTTLQK